MDTNPDEFINQSLNTLKIPDNIIQFGQHGYYPLSALNELCNNYCVYCGELCCPCDKYMNDFGKRSNNNYSNDEPPAKKGKLHE
jgi:hypothetical protein